MEKRIYTDVQVAGLPDTDSNHIHAVEWKVRKRSADRLVNYLSKKNKQLNILEVGCGNGWLSGRLAGVKKSSVVGIDINEMELNQARRVFRHLTNVQFETGSLKSFPHKTKFDAIVFAASIQYFPDLHQTIHDAVLLLNPGGEIHILDSHFYAKEKIQMAAQRSHSYYQSIGFGEMAEWYFHHTLESLEGFNYKLLYKPLGLKNRVLRNKDPFPWICISAL